MGLQLDPTFEARGRGVFFAGAFSGLDIVDASAVRGGCFVVYTRCCADCNRFGRFLGDVGLGLPIYFLLCGPSLSAVITRL